MEHADDPAGMLRIAVCTGCPAGQAGLAKLVTERLAAGGVPARVSETDCMQGCARPSTIAFRQQGKTAYLFGDVSAGDLDDLIRFAQLYISSPTGDFQDARPLGALRFKALARIPG